MREIPVQHLTLPTEQDSRPGDVRDFLKEAEQRITEYGVEFCTPAFVPSDYGMVYGVLRALADGKVAPGNSFCEWGSGLGVVACLAAMLDFEASGIEIEEGLVSAARLLADDFGLPVEFYCGSFIPEGGEAFLDDACDVEEGAFNWLARGHGSPQDELGLAPDSYDVIYAYPWPGEEGAITELFQHYGAVGAILMTYHGGEGLRLRRKIGDMPGRRRHSEPQ